MSPLDILVVVLGAGLIGWELWYFLGPRRPGATGSHSAVQEIRIVVKGGYEPDTVLVEAGRPVRLLFYRDETAQCSERVIFETLGLEKTLPAFETTAVEFTPATPGDYPFRCGMAMLHGRVVAQVGRDGARANLGRGHHKHG
ncbi:MAG TPA: cupredoxin domain-containing protein [Gemmatimonadales bacterium]|nr:cupredoxin domain-containing protein [Gemmatimonadales bacterium]